jgi:membrane glycosyltransferase
MRSQFSPRRITLRRLVFASLVTPTVLLLGWESWALLRVNGLTPLKAAIFVLFVVLLVPLAVSFWTAAIGFLIQIWGCDSRDLSWMLDGAPPRPEDLPLTAVVMPAYNEDPVRVFAGLKATCESVAQAGFCTAFEFFILSDTTDPDIWVREELAFAELREEVTRPEGLFYRNRRENIERKSGNIADFCAAWGGRYRYMIIMDADSVMTGMSLVNLVRLMERNPRAGIVQAPPWPVNGRTLFNRMHQFAARAYSSVFITGLNFWQGGAANYWGHNAIIRIRPFVKHCRLPKLAGKEPLGGSILSHDFVEGALMRRAGWRVHLAGELEGTYEELPSSLIAYAVRDRRWCQGNLQHARLLFTPGLHLVNRLHLWLGVMSYLSAPLWMLALALATFEGLRDTLGSHLYFPSRQALFPTWWISVQQRTALLFLLVVGLLVLPKCFSLILHLRVRGRAAGFGGRPGLMVSALLEILFSALLAPILAAIRTRFVTGTLMGLNVQWQAQQRGEVRTSFREGWRRHWAVTLVGLAWSGLYLSAAPALFWWFSPVLAGLVLAIPLSVWTSRAAVGQWARSRGLWLIPEEINTPELLQRLEAELQNAPGRCWAAPRDGLAWVLAEPDVLAVHLALLPAGGEPQDPFQKHRLEGFRLKLRHHGPRALKSTEKRELLLDADSLQALTREAARTP